MIHYLKYKRKLIIIIIIMIIITRKYPKGIALENVYK